MRVMRVLTRPNEGGPTRQAIALWHAMAARGARTLLVTGVVGDGERALPPDAHGVPRLAFGDALARLDAVGWVELPSLRAGIAPFADLRAGRQLRALARAWRPDVLHTHTSKAGWLGRRAAAACSAAIVHTFHGHVLRDYFPRWFGWLLGRLERRLARRSDALVAVSASCADELAQLGVAPRARFHVVPPAVPREPIAARAAARAALAVPGDATAIACVGRLAPIKRVERFLAAMAAMPDVCGDVIGSGPLLARLRAAAPPNVRFLGSRDDAASLLGAYDALALPSAREGWPLVAVEAARAGVPVAGYDVPGVRDAVGPDVGELAPADGGVTGLVDALRRALRRQRRIAGAAASTDLHDPAAVAARLLAIYEAARSSSSASNADRRGSPGATP